MTSRARVQKALHHEKPDRVPTFFRRYSPPGTELTREQNEYLSDVADVGPYLRMKHPAGRQPQIAGETSYDADLKIGRRFNGFYTQMVDFPLAHMQSPEELADYPWPDITQSWRYAHMRQEALAIIEQGKAVPVLASWGGSTGIFELSWYMRGMDNFLTDLMINVSFAEALLDKQLELHKTLWVKVLEQVGDLADMACTGDDLATQQSLLISPQIYRDLIKPRQKELIALIKRHTKAKIYYHSCGAIGPLIPDLVEIGVEVLDPVQPLALDTRMIKQKYGESLCFYGGVDVQDVLPNGTPTDVRDEVLRRFDHMGRDGGLVLGPSHWIQFDVAWENIRALYETIKECNY